MTDDDLIAKYAAEAKQSLDAEANKRIQETVDPIREAKLRRMSLFDILDSEELVPALLSRLLSLVLYGAAAEFGEVVRRRRARSPAGAAEAGRGHDLQALGFG